MVEVTAEDVKGFAPEFETVADEIVETYITFARDFVAECRWGAKAKQGIILMACHLMAEMGLGENGDGTGSSGVTGPVTSRKVGDLAESYAQLNTSKSSGFDQLLMTTRYGKLFSMLKGTIFTTPMVT